MRRLLPLLFITAALLLLVGCGNKGPLVRPHPAPAHASSAPAAGTVTLAPASSR